MPDATTLQHTPPAYPQTRRGYSATICCARYVRRAGTWEALARSPDLARRQFVDVGHVEMREVAGFADALAGIDTLFHTAADFRDPYRGGGD